MTDAMKRRVTVLASMISVLLVASVAFAAWTATGSGNGSAEAGAADTVDVTTAAVTDLLYPTGTADVKVTVTNPNPYAVTVTEISGNGAIANAVESDDCNVASVTRTGSWPYTQNQRIASGGSHTFTLTDAVAMSNAAADGCQNSDFNVPVTATAASAE